eukprot:TRINITY_DN10242_c0_g1_i1.p1 TRINITY_DN10242_c0_g1~~TRINITY_DN10242_c0_g1_i1.p1  ORF type:complete len:419 (+),score=75.05 TRINITY_DN10242_c0_g1_i1:85-1257(+)
MPPVPSLTVDLRQPPESRWLSVAHHFLRPPLRRHLRRVLAFFSRVAEADPCLTRRTVRCFRTALQRLEEGEQWGEIEGYAAALGVSTEALALAQLEPDLAVGCTSALLQPGGDSAAWLARTLDWDGVAGLRRLVCKVTLLGAAGRPIAATATFAGFVGVTTAQRHRRFAVALNYRPDPGEAAALRRAAGSEEAGMLLLRRRQRQICLRLSAGCMPVCTLLRAVALGQTSYAAALQQLRLAPVAAPCYLLAVGRGRGAVVRRDAGLDPMRQPVAQLHKRSRDWQWLTQANHDADPTGSEPGSEPRRKRRRVDAEDDSAERLRALRRRLSRLAAAAPARDARLGAAAARRGISPSRGGLLRGGPIANADTALGVLACPAAAVFEVISAEALQ